jgi:hypothetical protein
LAKAKAGQLHLFQIQSFELGLKMAGNQIILAENIANTEHTNNHHLYDEIMSK